MLDAAAATVWVTMMITSSAGSALLVWVGYRRRFRAGGYERVALYEHKKGR